MEQDRWRSKFLWVSVFALISFILGNWGLYDYVGLTTESFKMMADLIMTVFIAMGIINNPTDRVGW